MSELKGVSKHCRTTHENWYQTHREIAYLVATGRDTTYCPVCEGDCAKQSGIEVLLATENALTLEEEKANLDSWPPLKAAKSVHPRPGPGPVDRNLSKRR